MKRAVDTTVVVTKDGYIPASEEDRKIHSKFGEGEYLQLKGKNARSYKHHKKYFALCKEAAESGKEDPKDDYLNTTDLVDYHCRAKTGHIKHQITDIGEDGIKRIISVPKSIDYDTLDQLKFAEYYEKAVKVIAGLLGTTVAELEDSYRRTA